MFRNVLLLAFLICAVSLTACAKNATSPVVQTTSAPPALSTAEYHKLSAEEAKKMIDSAKPPVILDVRTEEEFIEKRIDGAVLIPDTEIGVRAPGELPDKDTVILVYCRSGVRSEKASRELVQMGYSQVYDIGGIIDWPFETVSGNL
jgi:rhodanese-related sulfurtransferase